MKVASRDPITTNDPKTHLYKLSSLRVSLRPGPLARPPQARYVPQPLLQDQNPRSLVLRRHAARVRKFQEALEINLINLRTAACACRITSGEAQCSACNRASISDLSLTVS